MSQSEILDAVNTLISPQLRSNYDRCIGGRSECSATQRLEEQLGSTQNSLSSLGSVHEDISVGAVRNGKMSVVRRFFCLIALFDLLLIGLTWLLCLMLMGSDKLLDILKMQILHYNITTSIFDIVLAAFCRFVVLLIFYGLLRFNTTFFVALTTLATCVFITFKVIYYSWNTASQPVFQVILVLMSFVITWAETWFLDFQVLPQEHSALIYAQTKDRFSESLSTLLLDRNLRSPVMRHFLQNMASQIGAPTESNGNFYSPVESPSHSDEWTDDSAEERSIKERKADQFADFRYFEYSNLAGRNQIDKQLPNSTEGVSSNDYLRLGKSVLEAAWSTLNSRDWKILKESPEGDLVYSKHEAYLGRVFLLKSKINIKPRRLLEELFSNVDKFVEWNKTLMESRRVSMIDERTDITYQVSCGNGVVSARDFVILRHWTMKGDCFVLAGASVRYQELPETKQYVRGENGPCCWAMKSHEGEEDTCSFEFLLNTDLKGWIPQYVLEKALISVLFEYSTCLKEYCEKIRAKECS